MRLFIATPTYDTWQPEFGHSLAWTMMMIASEVEAIFHRYALGTQIHVLRNDLAEEALEVGATHILWTDADMKFKPEQVLSLISRKKDIVGVNYIRRQPPHTTVAIGLNDKYLPPRTGLEEVIYSGMGLMLTSTDVFRKMPMPWFSQPQYEDSNDGIGEDVYFCKKAADNGFKIYVDHDASVGIGHVSRRLLEIKETDVKPKIEGLN